ncbi:uncharacterized protein K452DRAFT_146497 [Aplosporella prunicola CBS 121167]|uniref:Uncharacterized protein n=1 Tax=Aplosporella prunicola CBS 121167 TaxID=1176127 RepID=A0A6A6BPJ2_9PEZI|nr:uncharacterized protein K452DRAFT_146497 [Aplosporella prunicola CBS 121167]KAF2144747.1 hypothetical protein K452DRAFT_146497 [Aplosporella prunicola CBS 121167]
MRGRVCARCFLPAAKAVVRGRGLRAWEAGGMGCYIFSSSCGCVTCMYMVVCGCERALYANVAAVSMLLPTYLFDTVRSFVSLSVSACFCFYICLRALL